MDYAIVVSLNDNLKKQVGFYDILIKLEQAKQDALIANNISELDKVTGQEEFVLSGYMKLEKECFLLISKIAEGVAKNPEDISLVELAERYPILKEPRAKLAKAITTITQLHEVNAKLIYQGMQVIEYTVGLMSRNEKPIYTRQSSVQKEDESIKNSLWDRRV